MLQYSLMFLPETNSSGIFLGSLLATSTIHFTLDITGLVFFKIFWDVFLNPTKTCWTEELLRIYLCLQALFQATNSVGRDNALVLKSTASYGSQKQDISSNGIFYHRPGLLIIRNIAQVIQRPNMTPTKLHWAMQYAIDFKNIKTIIYINYQDIGIPFIVYAPALTSTGLILYTK